MACDLRKRMLPEGKVAILRVVRICSHMGRSGNRKLAGSWTKEGPGYTLNAYSSVTHCRREAPSVKVRQTLKTFEPARDQIFKHIVHGAQSNHSYDPRIEASKNT